MTRPALSFRPGGFGKIAQTLAIGAVGGGILTLLDVPASWLCGSMVAVSFASLTGVSGPIPRWLRAIAFLLLGVSMGASVTPDIIENVSKWPVSITALILIQPVVIGLVWLYLHRIVGWTSSTALFSAIPGALSYVVAVADQSDADMQKVTVAQSIRIFILVVSLPAIVTLIGSGGAAAGSLPLKAASGLDQAAIQLAAGSIGAAIFFWLRVPAGVLLGAFAGSAVLHGTGIAEGRLPVYFLVPGLVIMGSVIGGRFVGATFSTVAAVLKPATIAFAIAMAVNTVLAFGIAELLDAPFAKTLLAFAPGGLDAMTVLAFALALDPAFVAAHHTSRFLMMIVVLPILARHMLKKGSDA